MEALVDHHTKDETTENMNFQRRLSKTNAFFSTNEDSGTPRPPPSISRKISIKQQYPTLLQEKHESESYANRIRNLVAATRQASNPNIVNNPTKKANVMGITEEKTQDKPMASKTKNMEEIQKRLLTEENEMIPLISCLQYPSISTEFPQLSNEPTLGDENLPPRRQEISSPAIYVSDEDIIGKQIGVYKISKLLGVGAFSKVYIGHHTKENRMCAVKTIQKGKLLNDPRIRSSIEREIGVLKYVNHTNIVHLEATMEAENFICIVLEYVEGGELFDFVQNMPPTTTIDRESITKNLFIQLVQAVKWLHDHHIVHRDLKLENILIHKQQNNQLVLKITDFGLARVVDPDSPLLTTRCGSEEYAAPEIIQGKNYDGRKTDAWALGIILYSLLVGYLPFRYDPRKQERPSQLFYRIVRAELKWPKEDVISADAKYVVSRLLERDSAKRISMDDIMHLSWFS